MSGKTDSASPLPHRRGGVGARRVIVLTIHRFYRSNTQYLYTNYICASSRQTLVRPWRLPLGEDSLTLRYRRQHKIN